jgi:hypothetical protein
MSAGSVSLVMTEPRHPGDAKDLPTFISRAPSDQPVMAIRDVLVLPTTIVEGDYREEDEPAGEPAVEIAHKASSGGSSSVR